MTDSAAGTMAAAVEPGARPRRPRLVDAVRLAAGAYRLGPPGEEREAILGPVLIGRFPVVNRHLAGFLAERRVAVGAPVARRAVAEVLADHPATGLTRDQAEDFCAWASARLGPPIRLPTGDEWEACARGPDARTWPWGDSWDETACACAEASGGWTSPVDAHPRGVGPSGAWDLAGNVWEWVADRGTDGWGAVRGGCYLDTAAGLRAWRELPADPARATATTGFRIAIDIDPQEAR